MRFSLFILVILAAIIGIEKSAEAQSYPWCAYYNMGGFGGGGATNCGFATWQQCQAAIKWSRRVLLSQSHVPAPTRNVSLD